MVRSTDTARDGPHQQSPRVRTTNHLAPTSARSLRMIRLACFVRQHSFLCDSGYVTSGGRHARRLVNGWKLSMPSAVTAIPAPYIYATGEPAGSRRHVASRRAGIGAAPSPHAETGYWKVFESCYGRYHLVTATRFLPSAGRRCGRILWFHHHPDSPRVFVAQ